MRRLSVLLVLAACGTADEGPCPPGSVLIDGACVDAGEMGIPCMSSAQCGDGLFCNGEERCAAGRCVAGAAPCEGVCIEDEGRCGDCPDRDDDGFPDAQCGGTDCDDTDPRTFPGATELCDDVDNDCDPTTLGSLDADMDGVVSVTCCNGDLCGADCNDANAAVQPGATEACNAGDDDCDGTVDEELSLADFWPDLDGDLFGDPAGVPVQACVAPPDTAPNDRDCDDSRADVNPAAAEVCDDVDNDCNGAVDDDDGLNLFYRDSDGDGVGESTLSMSVVGCEAPPGFVPRPGDCDDSSPTTFVGAPELCDNVDNDCSNAEDPGGPDLTEDGDGDLHAVPGVCSGGWPDDDCDDTAPEIFTGAPEFCSGSDDDCDGTIDEAAAVADDCAEGSCELGCRVRRSRDLGSSSACGISGAMDAVSCWGDIPGPFTAGAGAVHTTLTLGTDAERAWAPVSIGLTGAEVVARNPFAACAVLADRTLRCWGHNDVAALGVGDFALRRAPVTPPGLSEVIDVAVGPFTVCALQADGEVYCWGDTTDIEPGFANFARLGQPTSAVADPRRPTRVPSLERIVELENSGELFCARRYDGVVFCWGGPPIGDGSDVASEVPVRVVGASPALGLRGGLGFPGSGFFAPEQLMCAELTTGWQCWGSAGAAVGHGSTATASEPSPLTAPSDAPVDLSPGFVRSCAVLPGGGVECWGQDGDGSFTRPSAATAIETEGVAIAGVTGATSIVCGGTVCCVETAVDTRCFGEPASPTFGDGLARDGSVPTTHFGAADVATLAAGTAHLCVLETPSGATQGTVRCGGRASRGNLGIGSSDDHLRVTSTALTDAVSVDITRDRSCALRAGGGVSCWGAGAAGDAADTVDADVPLEVDLSGLGAASVSQVATGDTFSCLRDAGGAVRCWGSASALCGAAGSTCLQPGAPVDARRYDEVAAGEGFACARDGGRVYCWGSQSSGRLGNGLTASGSVTTPTLVAGLTDAVELALGDDHACARRATGAVACWGENGQSQLGDGGTSDRGTVEDVSGVSGATALRCGVGSCLARVAGGAWVGWGEDAATLGAAAGSSTRTAVPAAHAGTYLDLAIAAGTVCGLEAGGTVACWGRESSPAQDMRGLPPFSSP